MRRPPTPNPLVGRSLRAPVLWGVVWGHPGRGPARLLVLDPATVCCGGLPIEQGGDLGQ
jgi:hypothetical protein